MPEHLANICTCMSAGEPRRDARSTYLDRPVNHTPAGEPAFSWQDYTDARLAWIYQGQDRSAAQSADLKAWREFGQ